MTQDSDGRDDKPSISFVHSIKLVNCGLFSGFIQAGIFNPWDRALYLSLKYDRKFLCAENFRNPWAGVMQTITQRAISAGLYFPLEQLFIEGLTSIVQNRKKSEDENPLIGKSWIVIISGVLAGSCNGFIMNPVAAIKYHYWGKPECGSENFMTTGVEMFRKGRFRPFLVGSGATVARDVIFGGTFSYMRHILFASRDSNNSNAVTSNITGVYADVLAGCFATILSSPLNYVRNMHYATPPDQQPLSTSSHLKLLIDETMSLPKVIDRLVYLQHRLRIGWGTARVGCGMAFGSYLYERCSKGLGFF